MNHFLWTNGMIWYDTHKHKDTVKFIKTRDMIQMQDIQEKKKKEKGMLRCEECNSDSPMK